MFSDTFFFFLIKFTQEPCRNPVDSIFSNLMGEKKAPKKSRIEFVDGSARLWFQSQFFLVSQWLSEDILNELIARNFLSKFLIIWTLGFSIK